MDFNSIKNALEQNETPFYFYDLSLLKRNLESIKKESESHSFNVHYALKANSNNKILDLIKEYGLGADCVSGNEIYKAMEIGFENQNGSKSSNLDSKSSFSIATVHAFL